MPPITRTLGEGGLGISVADFTLAIAVQNLVWGQLQPLAGVLAMRWAATSWPGGWAWP